MKCVILLFALLAVLSVTEGYICKCNWLFYDGGCYYFSKEKLDWFEAEGYCHKFGGYLTKATTHSEKNWLSTTAARLNKGFGGARRYFWIGLHSLYQPKRWVWNVDNSKPSVTNWSPGQPDSASQKCAYIWHHHNYKWDNGGCAHKINFLCESRAFNKPSCTCPNV